MTFALMTSICLFHHLDRAQAAVSDLRELGLSEHEIAVVGDGRTELTGETAAETLQSMRVPDQDMAMLMDGLRDGGTIVAVRADEKLSEQIEAVFARHRAQVVDETVIHTNEPAAGQFARPEDTAVTLEPNRLDDAE
jgi:hypothetical protein